MKNNVTIHPFPQPPEQALMLIAPEVVGLLTDERTQGVAVGFQQQDKNYQHEEQWHTG